MILPLIFILYFNPNFAIENSRKTRETKAFLDNLDIFANLPNFRKPKLIKNSRHKIKPKVREIVKFGSNDAPFKASFEIPLWPSLEQRSGAAIHYAQQLVAAKNLFHYDNLPTQKVPESIELTTKVPKTTESNRIKQRIPFIPRKRPKNREEIFGPKIHKRPKSHENPKSYKRPENQERPETQERPKNNQRPENHEKPKNREDLFRPKFKYSKAKSTFKPVFRYDTREIGKKNETEDSELKVTIVFGEELDHNNDLEEATIIYPQTTARPKLTTTPRRISWRTTNSPNKYSKSKEYETTTYGTRIVQNDFDFFDNGKTTFAPWPPIRTTYAPKTTVPTRKPYIPSKK